MPGNVEVTVPKKIAATAGSLVLHEPPGVASLSVEEFPVQIPELPLIGAGNGLTVTILVAKQPDGNV